MPLKEINILRNHGLQYVPDLRKAVLPEIFRGRPVISNDISLPEADMVCRLCPTGAIGVDPVSIDLGKCIFCNECAFALPGKIIFTNDYKMATNVRQRLVITQGVSSPASLDIETIRPAVRSIFKHALKLRQVSAGGDNSAEMELNAAGNVNFDMGRYGIEFVASPRHADGIVITGPVSNSMAEALKICFDAMSSPKIIILAGTDAISGGVFNGSLALNRQFLDNHVEDLYIPGNPPHPLTIINGILDLTGRK